jgi:hypothetical protein
MKRSSLTILVFGIVLGIAIGLIFHPLVRADDHGGVATWLEVAHKVTTSIGGLGNFAALIIVLQQFYLLRKQSELVQKNTVASMDAQLYVRLDSFNRFVFEHSEEYDLLDTPYRQLESQAQRSKLHRMCELGFTFFEEIFKHHCRLKLLETEDWDEWEQNLMHFFRKPYVHEYWKTVAGRYSKSFQALANEHVKKMENKQEASKVLAGVAPGGCVQHRRRNCTSKFDKHL